MARAMAAFGVLLPIPNRLSPTRAEILNRFLAPALWALASRACARAGIGFLRSIPA